MNKKWLVAVPVVIGVMLIVAGCFFMLNRDTESPQLLQMKSQLKSHPGDSVLLKNMGNMYFSENKYRKALYYYNEAIKYDPSYSDAYNNIGLVYIKKKDYPNAESYLEKSIELTPARSSDPYNNLAMVYLAQNQFQKAIDAFISSIVINKDNFIAYKNLGLLYSQLGRDHDAITSWEKALVLKKDLQIQENLDALKKSLAAK